MSKARTLETVLSVSAVKVALGLMLLGATMMGTADAALVAYYNLDGNANDSVGGFHGTEQGSPTYVPSPVGGQAINLNGINQYVTTPGTATALGINGNTPKTITAFVRTETFGAGGIWDLGSVPGNGENYSLRANGAPDAWRAQFWGGDLNATASGSHNKWSHFALTYDGATARVYYNATQVGSLAVALNTNDGRPLEIGRWAVNNYFDGQVDEVRVYNHALTAGEVQNEYRAAGGYAEGFEASAGALPSDWHTSSGMNAIRLRTNDIPDSTYGLVSSGANGSPGTVLNVYNSAHDHNTGMAWGPILTVTDDTGSIAFKVIGGSHALVPGSQRNGGTGFALWDVEANDFAPGTFTTRNSNGASYEAHTISLAGLQGRRVIPVLVDRQTGSWAWTGVDSITATYGSVSMGNPAERMRVRLDYHFDNPGDFMGWTQGGGAPTDFQIGRLGSGGLISRHINLDPGGGFNVGEGFLSSTTAAAGAETPTGTLRSPDFVIVGDIIEFYISGGSTNDMALQLVRSVDDVVLRSAVSQVNTNDMDYSYWAIRGLVGTSAYLQLVDNRSAGGWGHIEIDAIRMIEFNVPEPATLTLCGLGLIGLARRRRKKA